MRRVRSAARCGRRCTSTKSVGRSAAAPSVVRTAGTEEVGQLEDQCDEVDRDQEGEEELDVLRHGRVRFSGNQPGTHRPSTCIVSVVNTPRTLGLAGTEVGRIGLGTNRLTHSPGNGEFVRQAVAAGVGLIDTAHLYTGGQSEATL